MAFNPSPASKTRSAVAAAALVTTTSSAFIQNANKHILRTLRAPDNPIAHSESAKTDLVIQSASTGHQNGGGGGSRWLQERTRQLAQQAAPALERGILRNTIIYVNGYTGETSIRELKALIQTNGGQVCLYPSAKTTHIVATNLSGQKSEAFLKSKANKTKVVSPEWVVESSQRGRRLPEGNFRVVESETQPSLLNFVATTESIIAPGTDNPPSEPNAPPQSKSSKKRPPSPPPEDNREVELDEWEMPPCAQRRRS